MSNKSIIKILMYMFRAVIELCWRESRRVLSCILGLSFFVAEPFSLPLYIIFLFTHTVYKRQTCARQCIYL